MQENVEIRNNNGEIEKRLATIYYRKNRQRNHILIITIACSVFLLYTAFSIADGKMRSDYLIDVRGMGTTANVSLENGSAKQYEQMKELSYLSEVGIKKTVASGSYKDIWSGNVVYVDTTVYEKMLSPAITDIQGSYPEKENELMCAKRCLEQMGVKDPKIGAEIIIELELQNGTRKNYTFVVSGYYTDYVDASITIPEVFVSKAFLEKMGILAFPADKIMAVEGVFEENVYIEEQLYQDIIMEYDSQQIFVENPMVMQTLEGTFGSVVIAAGCGLMVVLCAFMMIYNVISIAMEKEIQEYGLLKLLGTTSLQLKRIAYRQSSKNVILGSCIGGCFGMIFVKLFLNTVLQNLFLQGLGKSDVTEYYVRYLMAAILFTATVMYAATKMALHRVLQWDAISSVKYVETNLITKKKKRKIHRVSIYQMAWKQVTGSGRRLIISMLSLLLAGITAMGISVIMRGTDITNRLEQEPDFQTGILAGIFRYSDKVPELFSDDTQILSSDMINKIEQMDGVKNETIEQTRGCYALIDFKKDKALHPKKASMEKEDLDIAFATIQIVDDSYIDELEEYIKMYDIDIDIKTLKQGSGCVLLHHNELSQILNEKAKDVVGLPIHFYSLGGYNDKENLSLYEKGSLKCAGYLNMTNKHFPKLQLTSIGNYINYFIMTEEAFSKLGFSEKVFDISFDVEKEYQIAANQKLSQLVQQENLKWEESDTFYLSNAYTLLLAEEKKIHMTNVLMGSLVLLMFMIGILNFSNTLSANYLVRKKEFAIMECLGLTTRQKKQMLLSEGLMYWGMLFIGLLTLGSVSIWILGNAVARNLLYFKFVYPWKVVVILAILLLFLNLHLVWNIYQKKKGGTIRERLK